MLKLGFDEMKQLIGGHFEGYKVAYLISQKFIKVSTLNTDLKSFYSFHASESELTI